MLRLVLLRVLRLAGDPLLKSSMLPRYGDLGCQGRVPASHWSVSKQCGKRDEYIYIYTYIYDRDGDHISSFRES